MLDVGLPGSVRRSTTPGRRDHLRYPQDLFGCRPTCGPLPGLRSRKSHHRPERWDVARPGPVGPVAAGTETTVGEDVLVTGERVPVYALMDAGRGRGRLRDLAQLRAVR